SGSDTVAQLSVQAGALIGSILGFGGVATTVYFNLGPANLQFTPVSFQLQPTLKAGQTVNIRPTSPLTYPLTNPNDQPISPDVVLNGADLGPQPFVSFVPGQDTLGIRFMGSPIKVTPSWSFQEVLTNEVDLNATLDATLTVGKVSVNIPGVKPITAGPL